jgi:DNA polymerase-3 subunit beta
MYIRHIRSELLETLQTVVGVVERRQTLPILANLHMEATGTELVVRATDLEIEMEVSCPVETLRPGKITAPARKLTDILKGLPDGAEISFEAGDDQRMLVKSGKSRYTLATLAAEEYPALGGVRVDQEISLSHKNLKALIERVGFAMAQQDVRYYLNGMLFHISAHFIRSVATDGHRLAMSELMIETGVSQDLQIILPRKTVLELARLLDGGDELVKLSIGGGQIEAQLGALRITSKLIDGRFPDYERVIPEPQKRKLCGNRQLVRAALARAAILSNEKFRGVRLTVEPDFLKIQTQNPEREEAEEEVEISFEGDAMEIGFNVGYLLDALDVLSSEQFVLELRGSDSSGLLYEAVDAPSAKYVVMPMRL